MDEPIWEEPPPDADSGRKRGIVTPEFLTTLRKNPGKWARIDYAWRTKNAAKSYANSVRGGYNSAWGKNEDVAKFDFRSAPHPEREGHFAMWVSWTGTKSK